jgi:hypothetical protein
MSRTASPRAQLAGFIGRYTPEVARVARGGLRKLRALLPGALELVYDNYNALAIGFSPTERASDVVVSLALYPRWVSLFLMRGARLEDPEERLKGGGTSVRHVVLASAAALDEPAIRKLIAAAAAVAPKPIDPRQRRRIIIKSISARQRPRRP